MDVFAFMDRPDIWRKSLAMAHAGMPSHFCAFLMKAVYPEVVGNGARRLRRFNLSTPLRSWNFSVFPAQTRKRAEPCPPPTSTSWGCPVLNEPSGSCLPRAILVELSSKHEKT